LFNQLFLDIMPRN